MSQPAHELFCFAHLTDVRSLVPPRYCYSFTGQGLMAGDGCDDPFDVLLASDSKEQEGLPSPPIQDHALQPPAEPEAEASLV